MADRATLAVSKLDDFKEWLKADCWEIQEPKAFWEVLRAVKKGRKHPLLVFKRMETDNGTPLVHYSTSDYNSGVVRAFLKATKKEGDK